MHLDSRSLAVFRIALGGLVFALAWQLRPDYSAFFLPDAPPHLIWALLNVFLPLFSLLLALGFFSRLCSVFCWAGVIAVQQANLHILYGADLLLHLLLFWSIFLPLGESWSLDAWLFKKQAPALSLSDRWAAWAITGQICLVYWSASLSKSDPLWTQNHNALFYVLSLDDLTTPLGASMRQHLSLLRWMTSATLCVEFLGPFLLFIPFYRNRFRMMAVILFFIFHLVAMQSLLRIGFFPWVCATAWLVFIPAFFWDVLTGPIRSCATRATPVGWTLLLDRCLAGLVLFSFADVLVWNAAKLHDLRNSNSQAVTWMKQHDPSMHVLHLNQGWLMYAPSPDTVHGWLVVPAELADGTQIDLFTRQSVSWTQPQDIGDYLGDDRWRAYLSDVMRASDREILLRYGEYLVNNWDAVHPEYQKVKKVTLIFMKLTTQPNLTISQPERVQLWEEKY